MTSHYKQFLSFNVLKEFLEILNFMSFRTFAVSASFLLVSLTVYVVQYLLADFYLLPLFRSLLYFTNTRRLASIKVSKCL